MYDPEDVDLASLRRQLRERSTHREELDHIHQKEKAELSNAHQHLQHSLFAANETLQDRQRLVYDGEKEIAKLTAARQRQLHAKEEKIAQLEAVCREQRSQLSELEASLREAVEKQATCRSQLSTVQAGVEQQLRSIRSLEHQIAEGSRAAAAQLATKSKLNEVTQQTFRRLEARAAELEQIVSNTSETTRGRAVAFTTAESAYAAQISAIKNATDKVRQEVDAARSRTATVRQAIQNRLDDDEQSIRLHRKAEEDSAAELQAAHAVALQRIVSERDEALRTARNDIGRSVDELKGKVEFFASQLLPLRDESRKLFDLEVRLIDELSTNLGEATDVTIFDSKLTFALEAKQRISSEQDETQDQLGDLVASLQKLEEECRVMDDVIAPLGDVIRSIQELQHKIDSTRANAADDLANHMIAKATKQQQIDVLKAQLVSQRLLVDASDDRRRDAEDDVENRRQQLHAEQRTLETELAALDAKLQDNKSRGAVLDSTLEHVSSQRKALLEEAEIRRDAARKAAATLLAQLE